ncbi:thioredoxin family protein [Methyloprofundus sp.]|uniref:thioredoxin family protein n=1 Tax=Methyloprofundus sp. TaxID=2020875 RepID=UPI003D0CF769
MAATHSNMMPMGTLAPEFSLLDTISGKELSLSGLKGNQGTIVMFICNHCPYVIHIKDQLMGIAHKYAKQGVRTIAISANDIVNYPQDAPDKMQALMAEWGNPFAAYLFDETQQIAKAYQAACTPDIYLFDNQLACVYHGRLDGATPKNDVALTGEDLRRAVDALLAGESALEDQVPSIGCNIKWKP